ncbi:MAG: SDR family oxidoreductase [Dehalococcoidales bacterium]|nr:SDR family oxidoreductase [Dehalococcoidales bacterium]
MRVLVTGADGYIGSLLAPYLMERGHDVVGLDTGFYRDGWLYDGVALPPPTITKDIRHVLEDDLRGFDAIAHLAELSNDPLAQHSPSLTFKINHLGSVELAKKCKKVGVSRFVYTSSCSVYGAGGDGFRAEESATDPQTAYAKCKVLVERDLSQMADDDFSPTFLRNATAFGPSPRMRFDIVLNNLAGLAWTTREIKMISDGTPWRPLVHVLDICKAIACTLEAPREVVHNQVFNVGDTKANHQVRDIAQIVAQAFPGCALTLGTNGGDNRSYRVSFEKINRLLLGFKCERDAMSGANQLLEIFQMLGMTRENFEFRAFTRLKQLEYLKETGQIDDDLFWRARQ